MIIYIFIYIYENIKIVLSNIKIIMNEKIIILFI